VLVTALVILPLFPFVVFTMHIGRDRPIIVRDGRRDTVAEQVLSTPASLRQFTKERRGERHLTPGIAVIGMMVPLIWVAAFALVGRRGFALRV
jgi:hypothetical protein